MRKLFKHEKTTLVLGIIGLILMGISFCPGGWESATGMLQGLSTGLWSGIILLFVNGIKSREVRKLAEIYDTIYQSNFTLIIISDAYSDIYHKNYHGKKERMSCESYLNIVKETFNDYIRALNTILHINIKLIPDKDIRESLDKLREKFYDIQHESYVLRSVSLIFEKEIYDKKVYIHNSLI